MNLKTFTLRLSDFAKCPIASLDPKHWNPDGTCKCKERR